MRVFFLVLFILSFTLSSEAQLRCFQYFATNEVGTPGYYAEVVDQLNTKYNHFLFDQSLTDRLEPRLRGKNISAQTKARYQAFKLRRLLKDLKSVDGWDRYDFENFSKKLEQLTFLSDLTVTRTMSKKEKIMYHQVRHSLLTNGLENFLFADSRAPASFRMKIFNWVMTPFKDIYSRWSYALFYMPKLNGALIPFDLAAKIAWEGLEKNRHLLKPYELHSSFKAYFNVLSSVYNWGLVTALFGVLPAYGYLTYEKLEDMGNQQAQVLFTPMIEHSVKMAKTDFHAIAQEKKMNHFLEEFRAKFNREPTAEELEMVKKIMGS